MLVRLVRSLLPFGAMLALGACTAEEAPEPKKPDEYAQVLALAPKANDKLGRVVLPAAAVSEIVRPDLGDVRVFDAKGRKLSLALAYDRSGESSLLKAHDLPAIALIEGPGGMSIPVLPRDNAIEASAQATASDAAAATGKRASVLIDTRSLALPVVGLEIAAELPKQVPVTFTLESGSDLKTWEPLADKVLLRPGNDPEVLGQPRIALPAVNLKDRYVRISWEAGPDIAVTGAKVLEAIERQPSRVDLETSGAQLSTPHELRFAPQIAVPIAAVKLELTGSDGIVPVQLFGRDDPSDPWGLLANATLKQGEGPVSLELSGASLGEYRIVADPRSAGFSKVPEVTLAVDPITIFAAFNGEGPFNLAVGHPDAKPAWFDPADFGTASDLRRAWRRPVEVESAGEAPVIKLAPAAPERPYDAGKIALWAALALTAMVLAFAAWRLVRAKTRGTASAGSSNAD